MAPLVVAGGGGGQGSGVMLLPGGVWVFCGDPDEDHGMAVIQNDTQALNLKP